MERAYVMLMHPGGASVGPIPVEAVRVGDRRGEAPKNPVLPWERVLRVTVTLDARAPDDRTLSRHIDEALREVAKKGTDSGDGSVTTEDGVTIHVSYENRYFEKGKLAFKTRGGSAAPAMPAEAEAVRMEFEEAGR